MAAAFLSRFFMKLFSAAPKRLKEPKKRDQRRHADGVKHNSFPRRSNPRSEREKANAGDESNKRSLDSAARRRFGHDVLSILQISEMAIGGLPMSLSSFR